MNSSELLPLPGADPETGVFTVSRLNRQVRNTLEDCFDLLWVRGEISNLARPSSGHVYFTIKDDAAQLRCVMFRNKSNRLSFNPERGLQVLVQGRISLYELRGECQLVAEDMRPAGIGDLHLAFEALKRKLQQEGLFEEQHKRPLPVFPGTVGIISSPTGAAVRDVLSVLRRRFPMIRVILYPVPVQGAEAAGEIERAFQIAQLRAECDALILTRGGGSLEDLWPFNEERVARAIYDCPLPVVSGVGHEVDFTIADFVADRRAPTPSAAAELLSPSAQEFYSRLQKHQERLARQVAATLQEKKRQVTRLQQQLHDPRHVIGSLQQRCDELSMRMERAWDYLLREWRQLLDEWHMRIGVLNPQRRLTDAAQHCAVLAQRLQHGIERELHQRGETLLQLQRMLEAVSPLSVLERGYAILKRPQQRQILRDAAQLKPGERLQAQLHRGSAELQVERVHPTPVQKE